MQFLAKAGLATLLVVGTVAGVTAPASAQVDVYIGSGRPPPPDYNRPPPRGRGCDPRLAEDIARDYGFRRARVVDVTPRRVIVEGWTRRGADEISFANARGCPVLRR